MVLGPGCWFCGPGLRMVTTSHVSELFIPRVPQPRAPLSNQLSIKKFYFLLRRFCSAQRKVRRAQSSSCLLVVCGVYLSCVCLSSLSVAGPAKDKEPGALITMVEFEANTHNGHKVVGVVLRSKAKTIHFLRHAEGSVFIMYISYIFRIIQRSSIT